MQSNLTPEEDEQLTHEKRVEEAEQADRSFEEDEDDLDDSCLSYDLENGNDEDAPF